MSIQTGIAPSYTPGTKSRFDTTSAARGLSASLYRFAVIGARLNAPAWATSAAKVIGDYVTANGNLYRATVAGNTSGAGSGPTHTSGTATDGTVTWLYVQPALLGSVETPYRCYTESDAINYAGMGSEAHLNVKAALRGARKANYAEAEIYLVMVADAGGARAGKTLTVTVTTAQAGEVVFRIAGRTFRAPVSAGDAVGTIASAIKSVIDAQVRDLPVTASASAGVVSIRANNAGPNGNDIAAEVVSVPTGVSVALASPTAGTTAYDITAALNSLSDKRYHGVGISNHLAADITDAKDYIDARGAAAVQAWSMVHLAETGSVATSTTLASAANYKELQVILARGFPNMPGEIACYVGALTWSKDVNVNLDDQELDLYPPATTNVLIPSESETVISGGVTPLGVTDTGDRTRIIRAVTTKTTEAGVPFDNLRDVSTVRTMFQSAERVQAVVRRILATGGPGGTAAKIDSDTIKRVEDSVYTDLLTQQNDLKWLHNVEEHRDELQVEADATIPNRLNIATPQPVVQDLHHGANLFTLYVEAPAA